MLVGVPGVETSRSLRRRGDSKTTLRHRRHTWVNVCHASIPFFVDGCLSAKKPNTSSRASSGSISIDITRPIDDSGRIGSDGEGSAMPEYGGEP